MLIRNEKRDINVLHVRRNVLVHDGASDADARQDGGECTSKPGVTNVGQHETSHKRGKEHDHEGNLFGDTLLDKMRVRLNARGNLSGADLVEVCDVLAESSLEVAFTNALGCHLSGVDPGKHL